MNSRATIATAFAPGHITGFFVVHQHADPRFQGTTGCGIVLDKGVTSTVTISPTQCTEIVLNGSTVKAPVTAHLTKALVQVPVRVSSVADIPVGSGFGASASGAMSAAYALNNLFSLGLTQNTLVEKVHVAEVLEGGGLGDVEAQAHGGVVIRKFPGPLTTTGKLDRISCSSFEVHYVVLGSISTKEVLGSPAIVERINRAGNAAMETLMLCPTVRKFMEVSRDFSCKVGLLSERAKEAIETVEASGGQASQVMLGDAVFAIADESCREAVLESLGEFGNVESSRVSGTY